MEIRRPITVIKTCQIAILALAIVPLACTPREENPDQNAKDRSDLSEETFTKDDVDLTIASWQQVQEAVAAHRGKIVVLDVWSTNCLPCMEEFPNLVKLHDQHKGGDIVCMAMSVDYVGRKDRPPEFYRDKVLDFLVKQKADFQNYLLNQDPDVWYGAVELNSIPAVFVYGRDSQLVQRFDNDSMGVSDEGFTYKNVNELLDKLLKEPQPE